jgi:hypothetical protein
MANAAILRTLLCYEACDLGECLRGSNADAGWNTRVAEILETLTALGETRLAAHALSASTSQVADWISL